MKLSPRDASCRGEALHSHFSYWWWRRSAEVLEEENVLKFIRVIFTHLKHTSSNRTGRFQWVKSRPGNGISIKLMFKTAKEVMLPSMLLLFYLRDTCGTPAGHLRDTCGTPAVHLRDTCGTLEGHLRDTCRTPVGHLVPSSISAPFCTGKTAHTQDPKDI